MNFLRATLPTDSVLVGVGFIIIFFLYWASVREAKIFKLKKKVHELQKKSFQYYHELETIKNNRLLNSQHSVPYRMYKKVVEQNRLLHQVIRKHIGNF